MALKTFHFDYCPLGDSRIDSKKGIVYGVTVITSGAVARGHDLVTDDTTLLQMLESAEAHNGRIPSKRDHKTGISEVNGTMFNFRIEGSKLKCDWELLQSQKDYAHTLELCEKMHDIVGLSASFTGEGEETRSGKAARCTDLISIDFVTAPAVNSGLFEARVDNDQMDMSTQANPTTEQMLQQILAGQTQLSARLEKIEEFNSDLVAEQEAAMQAAYERGEIDENGNAIEQEESEEQENEEIAADENDGPVAQAFAALSNRIINLEAQLGEDAENAEVEQIQTAFSVLNDKIEELTAQRDEALELLEQYTNPETGVGRANDRSFSANGNGEQTEFEQLRDAKIAEGMKLTEAISFCVKNHPDLYATHLESQKSVGSIQLGK